MSHQRNAEELARRMQAALRARGFRAEQLQGVQPRSTTGPYPALPPVRRFWIEEVMDGRPGLNVLSCLVTLRTRSNLKRLRSRLLEIASRTETLRCVFRWQAGMVFADPLPSVVPNLVALQPGEALSFARQGLEALRMSAPQPPWRIVVEMNGVDVEALLLQVHHAVLDWHGLSLLAAQLLEDDQTDRLATVACAFSHALSPGDAAAWWTVRQRQMEREEAYWRKRLAGLPPPAVFVASGTNVGHGNGLLSRTIPFPGDLREALLAS